MNNPYASKVFIDTWFEHFGKIGSRAKIKGIEGIEFFKNGAGIYVNSGKTHTKGIFYSLTDEIQIENKTLLINDVPTYFGCPTSVPNNSTKLKTIKQYPGFLIELDRFDSLDDYMRQKFKKSSRYKLNKYKKRLTQCFDIQYKMYTGKMDEKEYHRIFERFRLLLEKRFEDKGEHNNNLDKKEWGFYEKVGLGMIQEKKAGLFVIEDHGTPIAITLNYFSEHNIFDAITVFDIDYGKFHLGSVNIMFLIEWGIKNGYKVLDFSKGYFDYKIRWSTKKYDFEYHVLYNPKSLTSRIKAFYLTYFFKTKQYLRDQGINKILNKIRFVLKRKNDVKTQSNMASGNLTFEDYTLEVDKGFDKIDGYGPKIKKVFFEFLYLFGETSKDVNVFQAQENGEKYVFKGRKYCKTAILT